MALVAVVHGRFMLHMAKDAVAVMGSGMGIGAFETFCLFSKSRFVMTLNAGGLFGEVGVLDVRSVANRALDAALNVSVGAEFCFMSGACAAEGKAEEGNCEQGFS